MSTTLIDRLAAMGLPSVASPSPTNADDVLAALVEHSDGRGRYFADPRLVAGLFWEHGVNAGEIAAYLTELASRGDISVRPEGTSSYTGEPVDILFITNRQRFARFAARTSIPDRLRRAVYDRDGWRCVTCGSSEQLSLDHIYPFSLGGEDTEENLQTLCRSCNSRKGARI